MNAASDLVALRFQKDREYRLKLLDENPVGNPFRELRKAKDLTLGELSTYSHIDRRALQRLEQGMYAQPLPSLVDYLVAKYSDVNEMELLTQYEDYQLATRQLYYQVFGPSLEVDLNVFRQPFRQLRDRRRFLRSPNYDDYVSLPVGITEISQILCLPLDSMQYFEKHFRNQKSVPKIIKLALNQSGYSHAQVMRFEADYKDWRSLYLNEGIRLS